MRLLLDTHTFIWFFKGNPKLNNQIRVHHRDPFDRLLIAQAMAEQIPILSADSAFDAYSINRLW
jgi:PIN domain nuclease of toxin-antitoxin system